MPPAPPLQILWQDSDLVALMKPALLATIPGRGETDSVLQCLARQLKLPWSGTADPRVRVVHRLDKPTSGVLLMARHLGAQRNLSMQFQNGEVAKEYLALVLGVPQQETWEIDAPLAVHPTQKVRMSVQARGRASTTRCQIEQRLGRYTLVRCFPLTGRTHQIRVHLAHVGLPLAIDELYGSPAGLYLSAIKRNYRGDRSQERPLIDRLTLHAHRLTFKDLRGDSRTIEASMPKDFRAAVNMLQKYGRG